MGLDKFSAALDLLVGFHVNLYVGGDIFKGKLIGVETDHVVLETENKYIFYYNIDKINAITKNTKQFKPEEPTVEFKKTQSLIELLHSFQYAWVTILSVNKQSFYGVLSEIDEDFVTLINGEERILIKITHVSNILKGFIKEEPKQKKEEKTENKNKADNQKNESKESNESKDTKKEKETSRSKDEKVKEIPCHEPKEYTAEIVTSVFPEKKTKSQMNHEKSEKPVEIESSEVTEPNTIMVWSQPIKTESTVKETHDMHFSKDMKQQDENESMQTSKKEMKKPKIEMVNKEIEKKNDEMKTTEIKSNKENKQTSTHSTPKKEKKQEKPQETTSTTKPIVSQTAANKKTEMVSKEKYTNDTKKVWKQKDQETRAFRFTGEPVPRDKERNFPFTGWPSKNTRTFRF
ncbi:hypothetical protein [Neobacillus cucumis]|uniref:DUF2642 domain-containing protein n=1 Tax=Neobacillus cucumis TaxID=1740721 RepID=A0A2N5HVC3_9BACI|nr:hypothetical protein [Neobacillus cucumis]PLS09465.1 hypothetical protein CVD27_01050 [Neobacillus cucumis]